MADRTTFNGASANVPWSEFGDQYARHVRTLYDASALPLTNVSGTPNDVTAQVDPVLSGVLVDGMKFTITWAAANTGPMTLRVNTSAAIPVLSADGSAMIPNSAAAGTRSLIEFIGGAFRVLSGSGSGSGSSRYFWRFTESGTWQKPDGLPDDAMVVVEMWGGGGANAGGGGAYGLYRFRAIDIPASVPVSVGAGGTSPYGEGGRTNFGTLAHTYGGSIGGGGELQAGSLTAGGDCGGGSPSANARTIYGGGGGGRRAQSGPGGHAVYGGGGGAAGKGNAGVSRYGGNGGTSETSGQAPGGGGGQSANGARGEVRIWI